MSSPSSKDQLTYLLRHLLNSGEEEKARIARDLHDALGSSLTAVNMDLFWLKQRLAEQPALADRLARAMEVLASTVELKRRLIHELRPAVLDNLGLSAAIETHVADFSKSSAARIETDLPDELPPLGNEAPISLFRIYEEAVTNAARHAQASIIHISLRGEESRLALEIRDDGIGFDMAPADTLLPSVGLLIMRERAAAIGSMLSVTRGANGNGTVVRVVLPLPK